MTGPIPRPDHGSALAGVKAEPCGRPAAGLDPGSGHNPIAATGTGPDKIRSPRFQGIDRPRLPSGRFNANAAWLVCAAIAFNLVRALGRLAGGALARAETATVRARIINIPARVARSARRITLHLPKGWLWAASWLTAWRHALAPAR